MVPGLLLPLIAEDWSNPSYLVVTCPFEGWLLTVE